MPIEKRWVVKPQGDPATVAMLAAALRISPVLANLPSGASVTVLNEYGDWLVVDYRGTVGYASSVFIS